MFRKSVTTPDINEHKLQHVRTARVFLFVRGRCTSEPGYVCVCVCVCFFLRS